MCVEDTGTSAVPHKPPLLHGVSVLCFCLATRFLLLKVGKTRSKINIALATNCSVLCLQLYSNFDDAVLFVEAFIEGEQVLISIHSREERGSRCSMLISLEEPCVRLIGTVLLF